MKTGAPRKCKMYFNGLLFIRSTSVLNVSYLYKEDQWKRTHLSALNNILEYVDSALNNLLEYIVDSVKIHSLWLILLEDI